MPPKQQHEQCRQCNTSVRTSSHEAQQFLQRDSGFSRQDFFFFFLLLFLFCFENGAECPYYHPVAVQCSIREAISPLSVKFH